MFSKIKIIHINKTSSTQDVVIDYLKNDYYPSLLLVAKTQTNGRGRKEKDWFSPEGGFWATMGCSTSSLLNQSQLALFHYFTALLLARVIKDEYDLIVQIKWPNDLLYGNKKLAGVLIDYVVGSQKNYILIGMGVNLNNSSSDMPEDLKPTTISIKDVVHKSVSLDDFARKICFYANQFFSPIIEYNLKKIQSLIYEYNEHSRIYGKEVILDDSKKYYCNGINQEGFMQFKGSKKYLKLAIDDLTRIKQIIFPK
jgi:BirA family biotin operon repressor/biotin-[acetyl-CoA-carboxylase] ligase